MSYDIPVRRFFSLLKKTYSRWSADDAMRLGAALAYYTVFSLSPVLILALAVAGLLYDPEKLQSEFRIQLVTLFGSRTSDAILAVLKTASEHTSTASIVGLVVLTIGATGVFVELRASLNKIWRCRSIHSSTWWAFLKNRLLSLAMILSLGFLLLISLLMNTAVAAAGKFMADRLPAPEIVLQLGELMFSFCTITVVFALIFKYVPQCKVFWRDVWTGAALTAFLFTIGKWALGVYLGKSSVTSVFGAAASLSLVLIWAYYSSLILFFGAEFTRLHAEERGAVQ